MTTKRVLTGMRTTGSLHLGHYAGALKRWLEIQESNKYENFFLLADIQALTTHADQPELLKKSIRDVTLDWLSVGLDPFRSDVHFVLQSQVPARAELSILFTMMAQYHEVLRNPTLKDELANQKQPSLGFINYPVDQAADIYMVSPVNPSGGDQLLVPVGQDQVAHLEFANRLARKINNKYGNIVLPCDPLVGHVGRLPGVGGGDKMSKSKGNSIDLTDDAETVRRKVMKMYTDPNRISPNMPGDVINNPVFIYHRAFNDDRNQVLELSDLYKVGKVGDVEVKERLAEALNRFLDPIRERRKKFEKVNLRDLLVSGSEAAQKYCLPVTEALREKMFLGYPD